jgi:DNA polymerase-3 subunit epsilon
MRLLGALDFETTGVNPRECRPVSVAFNVVRENGAVSDRHRVVEVIDCGVDVPEEAAAIHGLTTEKVRECG